jgi:hypothetical protein
MPDSGWSRPVKNRTSLVQSNADIRTNPVIERPFWPITGYSISGQPNSITGHKYGRISNIYPISGPDIELDIALEVFLYNHATYDPDIRFDIRTQISSDIEIFWISGVRLSALDCICIRTVFNWKGNFAIWWIVPPFSGARVRQKLSVMSKYT